MFEFAENSQGVILLTLIIALSNRSGIRGVAEILDNLLGNEIMVVISRGIIRVTVTIGDCQARVSFLLRGVLNFAENSQGVILITLIIALRDRS